MKNSSILFIKLSLISVALAPAVVYSAPQNLKDLVMNFFMPVIEEATVLVLSLSTLYFFWGLVKFIFNQSSEAAKKDGKNIMTWGLVAMIVSFSIMGILNFLLGNVEFNAGPTETYTTSNCDSYTDPVTGGKTTTCI